MPQGIMEPPAGGRPHHGHHALSPRAPIRPLPTHLVNQIAAGEVIERPASVVRELVENALDAGAARVTVHIEEGGLRLIRVQDDGAGIPADELPLALLPHATSKLSTPEQLADIRTLGFRGEALASIASVSRLTLTSRPPAAEHGGRIESQGGETLGPTPTGGPPGTCVEVREIFYNTPARRKFLRSPPAEFAQVSDTLLRIALTHPQAAFRLLHQQRTVLDVPAGQSPRDRCLHLLGRELDAALIEFTHELPADDAGASPASVWGLAGLPSIARASTRSQYLCLNGRPIRDRTLSHAIKEAYRGLLPPDRHPLAVVCLLVQPRWVDVNVHPAKLEVRFHPAAKVHSLVMRSLRGALLSGDLTPSATLPPSPSAAPITSPTVHLASGPSPHGADHAFLDRPAAALTAGPTADPDADPAAAPTTDAEPWDAPGPARWEAPPDAPTMRSSKLSPAQPPPTAHGRPGSRDGELHAAQVRSFVDYFRAMDPRQRGFVYEEVRRAYAESDPQPAPATVPPADEAPLPRLAPASRVLQVHKSYLVTQDEHGVVIIDQHALHERVMFEELRLRVIGQSRPLESQRLLMPITLPARASRQAAAEALQPLLERIGVELAPIGPDALALHAFPSFLFDRGVEPGPFLEDLFDRVEAGDLDPASDNAAEAALHEVLDMMACKAAVKAGDALSEAELAALLRRRDEIERSSNCPHGRPTAIRLSLRDLEKQFKRG